MTLRKKTFLFIAMAFICLITCLYIIALTITREGFFDTETNEIQRDVERALNFIGNEIALLDNTTREFAIWDETYAYMKSGEKSYIMNNLRESTLTKLGVNYVLLVNNTGKIVFGKSFDLRYGGELSFPEELQRELAANRLLSNHANPEISTSGILLLPDGPMIISACPILTSTMKGPVRGTLIMGRSLDEYKIKQFAGIMKLSFVMHQVGEEHMPLDMREAILSLSGKTPIIIKRLNENIIAGYGLIKDVLGKPALILRVDQSRVVYNQSQSTIHYLMAALFIIAVIFTIIALLMMEKFALHRLSKLSKDVRKVAKAGQFSKRVSAVGSDEFSNLAYDINGMLEKLEALERFQEETNEARYRAVVEDQTELICRYLPDGTISFANDAFCRYFGIEKDNIQGLNLISFIPEKYEEFHKRITTFDMEASGFTRECQVPKDNAVHWLKLTDRAILDREGQVIEFQSVGCEITEHKQTAEELKQSEERYRSIFESAQEGIFRSMLDGIIILSNQAMAKIIGYASAEEMMTSVNVIAAQHYVNPEDCSRIITTIEKQGFLKGYESEFYRKDGSIIWISLTMHAVRDPQGRILYYDGIIEDITNRKQVVDRIRKALGATINAIVVTVEMKDPYTAGHQMRVADLARSIATEMNLPADMIDGIRMAATIHDLGKISVPSEILSKPKKLTDIEFMLIKTHAQTGYDILKDIEFPWPIARMVLEHHEKMNGSGYPNGLKEDNILLESRIIAVADVVESMGSHRPYRPSLGMEAALEEIEKNKGTLFDHAVVDACLRLFREKGYKLKEGL